MRDSEGCGAGCVRGYTDTGIRVHSYCKYSQLVNFQARLYVFILQLWISKSAIVYGCLQGRGGNPLLS